MNAAVRKPNEPTKARGKLKKPIDPISHNNLEIQEGKKSNIWQ